MTSPKSLLEWCCVTCAGYPGVDIKDMSSSFRDGLAFCAIIHKHRPDLIDFSSLCKDDIYQNNKLAFEVAETKLGIPALLDPKDLVSAKVPDCLSVIAYISQFYYSFYRKPCAFLSKQRSSHILKSNETSDGLRSFKSSIDLETSREHFPQARCDSCSQPVHLIQRRLSGGKLYHRSCFRCKICHSSHLVDCSDHVKDAQTSPAADQPKRGVQSGFSGLYSLDGSAITSVPRYTQTMVLQKKPARKTPQADEENRQTDRKEQEDTERRSHPVPAPRQSRGLSSGSVPASRIRTAQTTSSCPAAETTEHQSKFPPGCSHIPKVKSNHPWMNLVHPGPWTQLPLAPPPVPLSRAKSASNPQGSPNRPKVPAPPNPFEEEEVEEGHGEVPEPEFSEIAVQSENSGVTDMVGSSETEDPITSSDLDGGRTSDGLREGGPAQIGVKETTTALYATSARKHPLPRSLSGPAIPSDHQQTNRESACKDSPAAQEPGLSKGRTLQNLSSTRGLAPGHGFPLIRRKVQSEQSVCLDQLQKQRRELDGLLAELEQRGVELEKNIR
ncbi:MICAL-like protein 1, partial [Austrofundulus limnaeus]|uniref:MICAL-like protein 1 n=1 Tax=Austrofundulus limnaeus TaxID=52670 RepID=A0A2I4CYZ7_AUSLI